MLTNFAANASLNTRINDAKGEIPSITNLARKAALTTLENKIPNVSDLVKKADYDGKISEMLKKYFNTSDYNRFASNIRDTKITQKSYLMNLIQIKRRNH